MFTSLKVKNLFFGSDRNSSNANLCSSVQFKFV